MASNGKSTAKKQSQATVTVSITSPDGDDPDSPRYYTIEEIETLTKIKALAEEEREKTRRRSPQGQYTRQKPESKSST